MFELPKELINSDSEKKLDKEALRGKLVVGLLGYKKSGKDTFCDFFCKRYGFHRIAFGDLVKDMLNDYYGKNSTGDSEVFEQLYRAYPKDFPIIA